MGGRHFIRVKRQTSYVREVRTVTLNIGRKSGGSRSNRGVPLGHIYVPPSLLQLLVQPFLEIRSWEFGGGNNYFPISSLFILL